MLLSVGIEFMGCHKSHVPPMQSGQQISTQQARVSAARPGQSMDWDGIVPHDCFGVGTKCAVVYPDAAISSGWHEACTSGTLETYIQNNGQTFDFPTELLHNLINSSSINVKEGNGGYQYRLVY